MIGLHDHENVCV